jgi:hypothetical protein
LHQYFAGTNCTCRSDGNEVKTEASQDNEVWVSKHAYVRSAARSYFNWGDVRMGVKWDESFSVACIRLFGSGWLVWRMIGEYIYNFSSREDTWFRVIPKLALAGKSSTQSHSSIRPSNAQKKWRS